MLRCLSQTLCITALLTACSVLSYLAIRYLRPNHFLQLIRDFLRILYYCPLNGLLRVSGLDSRSTAILTRINWRWINEVTFLHNSSIYLIEKLEKWLFYGITANNNFWHLQFEECCFRLSSILWICGTVWSESLVCFVKCGSYLRGREWSREPIPDHLVNCGLGLASPET